jgi:hypothetical protein
LGVIGLPCFQSAHGLSGFFTSSAIIASLVKPFTVSSISKGLMSASSCVRIDPPSTESPVRTSAASRARTGHSPPVRSATPVVRCPIVENIRNGRICGRQDIEIVFAPTPRLSAKHREVVIVASSQPFNRLALLFPLHCHDDRTVLEGVSERSYRGDRLGRPSGESLALMLAAHLDRADNVSGCFGFQLPTIFLISTEWVFGQKLNRESRL